MSLVALEEEVAYRSVVEVDALQAHDCVFLQLFVILSLHLPCATVERREEFSGKEAEFKFRIELLEQFRRTLRMFQAQWLRSPFAAQCAAMEVGKEEVVEDAVQGFFRGDEQGNLCKGVLFVRTDLLLLAHLDLFRFLYEGIGRSSLSSARKHGDDCHKTTNDLTFNAHSAL